ncbi:Oidioi.mRNA.OKI2018_I69.chr2.g8260.t1.cds [Oikopleura dioica]|uniref:Oidioi.mRNA.OKI2018_I69.chr2.g8260.t1.cds n=1 Tax=Oikopleura dioica TaxID=34765 RepID=A0ABN7TC15_OIKDI|nr:Oidioi.mRNA.OKI2018_I69.chr2.g8260.t1.cds [Oikopleura dioica]
MSDAQQANARQIERPPSETEFSESSQELRDVNNKEKREYEADRVRIFMFCYICHKSMENFYTLSDDMKRCCPHIDWESYGMKRTIVEEEEPEDPEANDIFIIETETDTVTTVTRKTYPTPEPIFDPLLNPPVVASNPFLDKMLEEMDEY